MNTFLCIVLIITLFLAYLLFGAGVQWLCGELLDLEAAYDYPIFIILFWPIAIVIIVIVELIIELSRFIDNLSDWRK